MSLILFKIYDPLCPKLKTLIIYVGFKINNLRVSIATFIQKLQFASLKNQHNCTLKKLHPKKNELLKVKK